MRRRVRWLLLTCIVLLAIPPAVVGARLCGRPIDITNAQQRVTRVAEGAGGGVMESVDRVLPTQAYRVKLRLALGARELRYQVHAALGTALATARCDPGAIATQWLKAAYHAGADAEVDRAALGITGALGRAVDPAGVVNAMCAYLWSAPANDGQAATLERANLSCTG